MNFVNKVSSDAPKDYKEGAEIVPGKNLEQLQDEQAIITELSARIDKREAAYDSDYRTINAIATENREYYRGNQVNDSDLYEGESPIVVNRVFTSVETIIPLATQKTPEANLRVFPASIKSKKLKDKLERALKDDWEIMHNMKRQTKRAIRNLATSGYFAFKYGWDDQANQAYVKLLPTGKLLFPINVEDIQQAPFAIEYCTERLGDLKERFPEKADELQAAVGSTDDDVSDDTLITIKEYHENTITAWKYKQVFLGYEQNANYNFEEGAWNQFTEPRKPYLIANLYSFGDKIVDDVTMIGLVKTLQDSINKRKRQIEQNADMANGVYVVAGTKMSIETFNKMEPIAKGKIYLDGADSTDGAIDIKYGRAYDQGIIQDKQDSENEFNAVMGTSGTSLGERGQEETATGRAILKQADTTRIGGTLGSEIERFAQQFYEVMIQLRAVHLQEPQEIISMPETKADSELKVADRENVISREDFRPGYRFMVLVQDGSTIPHDKNVERAEAIDLAMAGKMSLVDMYKKLEYENPERYARNAIMEATDPMALYGELNNPDNYSPEAVRDIFNIIAYKQDPSLLFESQNPEELNAYIMTQMAYIKGTEIREDLPAFETLDIEQQIMIKEHIRAQNELLSQTIAMIEQQKAAMGIPPTDPGMMQQGQVAPAPTASAQSPQSAQSPIDLSAAAGQAPQPPVVE